MLSETGKWHCHVEAQCAALKTSLFFFTSLLQLEFLAIPTKHNFVLRRLCTIKSYTLPSQSPLLLLLRYIDYYKTQIIIYNIVKKVCMWCVKMLNSCQITTAVRHRKPCVLSPLKLPQWLSLILLCCSCVTVRSELLCIHGSPPPLRSVWFVSV